MRSRFQVWDVILSGSNSLVQQYIALAIAAAILFVKHEQKDNSGKRDRRKAQRK